MNGGGEDPAKYQYTRLMAFRFALGVLLTNIVFIALFLYDRTTQDFLSTMYLPVLGPQYAIIFHYMGVTNGWGFKK